MAYYQWIIEAPFQYLQDLGIKAGLPQEAIRPLSAEIRPAMTDAAQLHFPSFGCPSPMPWLKVLHSLAQKNTPIRIYLKKEEDGKLISIVRLYPKIDDEFLRIIEGLTQDQAMQIDQLSRRVEEAFHRLAKMNDGKMNDE